MDSLFSSPHLLYSVHHYLCSVGRSSHCPNYAQLIDPWADEKAYNTQIHKQKEICLKRHTVMVSNSIEATDVASREGSRGFPNSINSFMYRTDCIFIVLAYRKTNIGYLLLLFLASRLSPDESNFAWDCCKRDMCVLWTVDWTKRDFWRHHHGLQESVMALPDFFSNQESSIIPWEMCVNVRKCLIWQLWRKWDNIPGWVSLSISSKKLIGSILGRDPFYPNFGRTRFCSSCMILLMNQLAKRRVKTLMSWQR